MQKRTLFLFLAFVYSVLTFGQEVKFGSVDAADLQMTVLASDTAADAMVLFHKKYNYFDYSGGTHIVSEVHRRVKLFRRSSFDRADVEIYYHTASERISKLKAIIHLPNGEALELKKQDFVRDEYNEDFNVIKFTFPQVTEGAIIEYSYRKTDEGIAVIPEFFFQENIPVKWAEFEI